MCFLLAFALVSVRAGRFLPDGAVFDASNAPGRKPIAFKLGARQVIKGWEEVLRLMNVREYVHVRQRVRTPVGLYHRRVPFSAVRNSTLAIRHCRGSGTSFVEIQYSESPK